MGVCWRRGVKHTFGQRVVFAGWAFAASGSGDNTIKLWRVGWFVGAHPHGAHKLGLERVVFAGHHQRVVFAGVVACGGWFVGAQRVVFAPHGRLLASGSWDNTIKLWRVADGSLGHTGVWSVSFSPDGRLLASGSGDNTIKLWRVADGSLVRTLRGQRGRFRRMGVCWRHTIKLWRVADGSLVRTLRGHTDWERVVFAGWAFAGVGESGRITPSSCGGWRTARCCRPTTKKHSERSLSSSLRTGDCSGMDALMPPWWWRAIRSGRVAKETHSPRM
jgi:WD40 repeat protein